MTVSYRTEGRVGAAPLVLLNSVGADTTMWDAVAGPLAERFWLIRMDTRGHGASSPQPESSPGLAELGRDVLELLDELGVVRAHLAGLSLGGMTAMWLGIHAPERIGRLALLCTSAYLPPAQGWRDRAAAVRAGGMAAIGRPVVARWITAALAERDPGLVMRLITMLEGTDPSSYAWCCEAIAAMDLRPDLARIAAPTLVIGAADDPATPLEHQQVLANGIPGAQLAVVPDAAHLATIEQPALIAGLLLGHLADGEATRRAVLGDAHVDRSQAATTEFTAAFQDFITRYAWGEVWTRPALGRRDRSIATLAALVALGAEHEIGMHVRAAVRNGLTRAEIAEVLLHVGVYAGVPRANRAFAIASEVLSE